MKIQMQEILDYIHDHIPITSHLGAFIQQYDDESITIGAPLDANINHRNSVFGGSLSAIAILSGWALLFVKLKRCGIQNRLVIQHSSFDFLNPATIDFEARSEFLSSAELDRFMKMFARKGKARITIKTNVYSGSELCGVSTGVYVAVKI